MVLNGAPRSGKSTIAHQIQQTWEGPWLSLGVDVFRQATPARYQPGVGLRPGGERPDLEPTVAVLYAAMYDSVAAHSRQGLHVVVDVGHHEAYSRPLGTLADAARRLAGLPALLVGVRCRLEDVMRRREGSAPGRYLTWSPGDPVPEPVRRWEEEVHRPGVYDLEVDTSLLGPADCAEAIRRRLLDPAPATALAQLAGPS